MSLRSGYGLTAGSTAPSALPTRSSIEFSNPKPPKEQAPANKPGSFNVDFTDPVGSVFGAAGEAARFVGTIPFVGDAAKTVGNVVGAVASGIGDVGLDIGDFSLHLRDIPGALGVPYNELVAKPTARQRLWVTQQLQATGNQNAFGADVNPIPEDIKQRLLSGEDIDSLAQELVDRGEGVSSNKTLALGNAIVTDPLNFVSLGAGALGAVADAERLGVATGNAARLGGAYNTLTRNGSAAVKSAVRAVVGPATEGWERAYGAGRLSNFLGGIRRESATAADDIERYVGIAKENQNLDVIGSNLFRPTESALREAITPAQIDEKLATAAEAARRSGTISKAVNRDAEIEALRNMPKFSGASRGEIYQFTAQNLAYVLDVPIETAMRMLPKAVDAKTAAIVHAARYGKAIETFETMRDGLSVSRAGSKALQVERLTPIANETLTDKRIAQLLDEAVTSTPGTELTARGLTDVTTETIDAEAVHRAVERYTVLRRRFGGAPYTPEQVIKYVRALQEGDGVITELTSGLPRAARQWADESGYSLGYAPESGWKAIPDGEGGMILTDPFIPVTARPAPVSIRNPLGRLGDSLFSTIHQKRLVLTSERRMADQMVRSKLATEAQAEGIHRQILRESFELKRLPRDMVNAPARNPKAYASRLDEIFAEHLSPEQYDDLIKRSSPAFEFFHAIEGDLSEVGYTQKITGKLKAAEAKNLGSNWLVKVSEGLYPKAKFSYNPFFQGQERAETTFWKAARGVANRDMDPDVRSVIEYLLNNNQNFRIPEDFGSIFLNKGNAAASEIVTRTGIRRLTGKLADIQKELFNVAGTKRDATIAQVFHEYGEQFANVMSDLDPELYRTMAREYGTTNPAAIAEAWVRERAAIINPVGVEQRLGELRSEIQKAYDAGDFERGAALNKQAGALKGGSAESGGAIAGGPRTWGADEETVWQAFSHAIRKSTETAWQTQYFREGRGWLERSLNHPFLGLYPLSYASKVFMEFGRFLLKRPFGLRAPLAGLNALTKVQKTILAESQDENSGLYDFIQKYPVLVNVVNQMLPYWPTNVAVNAPLWVKDIAAQAEKGQKVPAGQRTQKGQNVTPADIGRSIWDQSTYSLTGPIRFGLEGLNILDEILADLSPKVEQEQPFAPGRY